jgi:hypothetical protein
MGVACNGLHGARSGHQRWLVRQRLVAGRNVNTTLLQTLDRNHTGNWNHIWCTMHCARHTCPVLGQWIWGDNTGHSGRVGRSWTNELDKHSRHTVKCTNPGNGSEIGGIDAESCRAALENCRCITSTSPTKQGRHQRTSRTQNSCTTPHHY